MRANANQRSARRLPRLPRSAQHGPDSPGRSLVPTPGYGNTVRGPGVSEHQNLLLQRSFPHLGTRNDSTRLSGRGPPRAQGMGAHEHKWLYQKVPAGTGEQSAWSCDSLASRFSVSLPPARLHRGQTLQRTQSPELFLTQHTHLALSLAACSHPASRGGASPGRPPQEASSRRGIPAHADWGRSPRERL